MEGIPQPISRTVEDVFNDFKGRRAGLVKALTTDVEKFYQQCDPEKENLCLYGLPNETWEVNLPVEEVPPELPEPALGINFARDGMQDKDWLSLVAVHSDSWLLSVAFYFGARFGFGKSERKRLFQMINELPTVFEVVTGAAKQARDADNNSNRKSKSSGKRWFHGKCVKITPAKAEHIKQYKCPSCSNKRARV
nr:PHD finger protein Alfin1 [Ipomoea batatas]GMD43925.1 PHD finger protein Alfin1 [Ipomoea batatas]